MKRTLLSLVVILAAAEAPALAQAVPAPSRAPGSAPLVLKSNAWGLAAASGTWWRNPAYVDFLGLTPEQQQEMDGVFQDARLKLIDLTASVDKEELILEPLINAATLDEGKVLAQIDRVAQARAELEKGNSRMLLGFRKVLTMEQWNRLQSGILKGGLKAKIPILDRLQP